MKITAFCLRLLSILIAPGAMARQPQLQTNPPFAGLSVAGFLADRALSKGGRILIYSAP
jgi:hypothetical protein